MSTVTESYEPKLGRNEPMKLKLLRTIAEFNRDHIYPTKWKAVGHCENPRTRSNRYIAIDVLISNGLVINRSDIIRDHSQGKKYALQVTQLGQRELDYWEAQEPPTPTDIPSS